VHDATNQRLREIRMSQDFCFVDILELDFAARQCDAAQHRSALEIT